MIWLFVLIILSYLSGSIPSGLIIGKKVKGIDIRKVGSGNIGTANAVRALGPLWGGTVFISDVLKGVIPVVLAIYLPRWFPGLFPGKTYFYAHAIVGLAAIIGHNYSAFLKLSGGKGIATSFGVFLVLDWRAALIGLLIWIVVVVITRFSSLGSLLGAISIPVVIALFRDPMEYIIFGVVAALLAIYKHRGNISRLIRGEERKITGRVGKNEKKQQNQKEDDARKEK